MIPERFAHQASRARCPGGFLSPTLEFYDAGHALGSAGMMVRGQKQTLFYTGDVSFGDQTCPAGAKLVRNPDWLGATLWTSAPQYTTEYTGL